MPSHTARKKFPAQLVIVTTDAVAGRIRQEAEDEGVSIAEVARKYLEMGMAAADGGLGGRLTVNEGSATVNGLEVHPTTRPPLTPSRTAFSI